MLLLQSRMERCWGAFFIFTRNADAWEICRGEWYANESLHVSLSLWLVCFSLEESKERRYKHLTFCGFQDGTEQKQEKLKGEGQPSRHSLENLFDNDNNTHTQKSKLKFTYTTHFKVKIPMAMPYLIRRGDCEPMNRNWPTFLSNSSSMAAFLSNNNQGISPISWKIQSYKG